MSVGWDGAEPAAAPPFGPAGWLRLALRGPAALAWTAGLFALFLAFRGLDAVARVLARRPPPALAPWVVQAWAHGALALLGLRVRRSGEPTALPGAVVANHASWLDIAVLQSVARLHFVAKSEVAAWPGIGLIGRAIGTVFIARRPTETRRQTEALHARLARGDRLCLFPEGTSTDGRRVLAFKSSLFGVFLVPDLRAALWVQPVSLGYEAPPGRPATFYAWWGDMNFGAHLLRMLALSKGGIVEVRFHPPLRAADYPDRKALAEAAGATVRAGHAATQAAG